MIKLFRIFAYLWVAFILFAVVYGMLADGAIGFPEFFVLVTVSLPAIAILIFVKRSRSK